MTHIRKAILICDKCGARLEIDPAVSDPFFSGIAQRDTPWREWLRIGGKHDLCPDCAGAYTDKQAEYERELKKLAGIKTIELDL